MKDAAWNPAAASAHRSSSPSSPWTCPGNSAGKTAHGLPLPSSINSCCSTLLTALTLSPQSLIISTGTENLDCATLTGEPTRNTNYSSNLLERVGFPNTRKGKPRPLTSRWSPAGPGAVRACHVARACASRCHILLGCFHRLHFLRRPPPRQRPHPLTVVYIPTH